MMKFKRYIFLFVFILFVLNCNVFAAGNGFDPSVVPNTAINSTLKTPIDRLFGTIITILQILSVAGVIIAGVRYMFIAPDAKAEVKKSLKLLIIGLVIVFAGATLSGYIRDIFISAVQ